MNLTSFDPLRDKRTGCYSVMTATKTSEYLDFIKTTYLDKGGLEEQREPLKTSSAVRIRKRMIEDIINGTILPPIVIGLVVSEAALKALNIQNKEQFQALVKGSKPGEITIIDGMQRTTALFEAMETGQIGENTIRVEFWISTNINSLIYRMLVLNTGQVPWNLRRQIEVIFRSMITEIENTVKDIKILTISDKSRRTQAGQYQASDLIELYLVFGARKEKIDTKERLADEFTRMDFIEATEDTEFTKMFYKILECLGRIDRNFGKFDPPSETGRFASGKDIFKSQPARVGFIAAISKSILGRPGIDRTHEEKAKYWASIEGNLNKFIEQLEKLNSDSIRDFIQLPVLAEKISVKTTKIGDFEREYFTKAFEALIEEKFEVGSLEICWRAY